MSHCAACNLVLSLASGESFSGMVSWLQSLNKDLSLSDSVSPFAVGKVTVLALLVIVRIKWHHRIWFLIGDLVKIVMLLEVGGAHGPPLHQRNY